MYSRKLAFAIVIVALVIALGAAFAHAQDEVSFPDLSGSYQVGKVEHILTDEARDEIFSEDADDKRELLVTVYYPAQPAADAVPAPYVEGALGEAIGLTPEIAAQIHSHVYAEAPVAEAAAPYPVVIFSPGMGNLPLTYSVTLQDFASNGYVVISISHPYSTMITVFPDGRIVTLNGAGSQLHTDSEEADAIARARILGVWVADARFVIELADADQ